MKQTAILLFITLLMFGCTSVPKKSAEESTEVVSKVETEAVEEKVPETEKEEKQVIQEEVIPEVVALLSREYSYYGDGMLDTYNVFTYKKDSTEQLIQLSPV